MEETVPNSSKQQLVIRLDIYIDAAPAEVWRILSTLDGMRRWQGAQEYEPSQGGKIVFHLGATGEPATGDDVIYVSRGEVKVFDPPSNLAYTWRQYNAKTDEIWPAETLVSLRLDPEGKGTRVRVVHSGFEQLPSDAAEQAFEDYRMGWTLHDDLGKLKRLVEGVL
jgi:uncharacterized protein YndB with AHSA1/START domain